MRSFSLSISKGVKNARLIIHQISMAKPEESFGFAKARFFKCFVILT